MEETDVSHADTPAETRAPDAIEDEIEATRERLAVTIDQLVHRASPKTIARREMDGLKAYFVDPHGSPRTDNIFKVTGVVVGVVALLVAIRKVAN
jgi:Protein of unknown function (DUF3618)